MADRTVVVRIMAQTAQYQQAMAAMAGSTKGVDSAVGALNRKTSSALSDMERQASRSARSMSGVFSGIKGMALGLGVPLAIGAMVKSFVDFERQMAHVRAVSDQAGRSAQGMDQLRTAALSMGAAYGFSATEVGQAEEELAKAGRSTAQIMGGELKSSLTLAAAGTISLSQAATIMAVTMTQFKDQGVKATQVTDLLAKAANATVSDVSEMGTSLAYVGPQADAMGMSLEDTITTISLFNQAGIKGDMAGTNLRSALVGLTSPSHQAATAMRDLGLNMYDTQGKFIGVSKLAEQLKTHLGGLSQADRDSAIGKLTTNAAMPGFITLMKAGATGVEEMRQAILNSASAEDVARDKLNSLAGDLSKFGAAISTSAIKTLDNLNPVLEFTTQHLTSAATAFGNMGGTAQASMLALGGYLLFGRQRVADFTSKVTGGASGFGIAVQAEKAAQAAKEMSRLAQLTSASQMSTADFFSRKAMFGTNPLNPTYMRDLKTHAQLMRENADSMTGFAGSAGRAWGSFAAAPGMLGKTTVALKGIASMGKAAGTAMLGAMGGWPGLLITGGLAAVTFFSDKAQEAATKAHDLRAALNGLGQEFGTSGTTSSAGFGNLIKSNGDLKNLTETAGKYGISLTDIGKAASGNVLSQQKVLDLYDKQAAFQKKMYTYDLPGGGKFTAGADKLKNDRKVFEDVFKTAAANAKVDAAVQADVNKELERHGIAASSASGAQRAFTENSLAMGAAEATLDDRVKALHSSLSMLTDAYLSVSDAQSAFYAGSKDAAKAAFTDDKGKKVKPSISPITGQFDVTNDAGAKQQAFVSQKAKAAADSVEKVWSQTYAATNNNAKIAGTVAVAEFQRQREALVGMLAPYVGGNKAARELLATEMALPADIAQKIDVEGLDQALGDLKKLGIEIVTLPNGRVGIVSNSAGETKKLQAMGGHIKKLPHGKFLVTFGNEAQLNAALNNLTKPRTAPIVAQAFNVDAVNAALDAAAHERQAIVHVTYALDAVPRVPGQTYTGTNLDKSGSGSGPRRWGGIDSFASGGIAQVAGPGTLIKWAEPETGGEAYIPRLGDKGRSKSILDVAAGWYGMKVMPLAHGGVMSFASGGVANGGVDAPLSDWFSRWGSPGTTKEDYTKAVTARLAAINAVHKAEDKLHKVQADRKHTTAQLAAAERDLTLKHRALDAATDKLAKTTVSFNLSKQNAWERFRSSTKTGVTVTGNFIANLNKLANRGFGQLANQLLAMGGADAEAIASGAVKASDATVRGTAYRVSQGIAQQKALDNMPATLSLRGALRSHTSYESLVGSGQVDAASLNAAITLMQGELSKTSAGRAMIAAMNGANAQALKVDMAKFATGGIAPEGTMYRFAEPGTGGEAVIPRMGSNALPVLAKAAAWHGMTLSGQQPWDSVMQRAGGAGVQITVRGEGVLAGMIEATVDGKMVQVARAVRHGTRAA